MSVFNIVVVEDSEIEMGLLSHIVESVENIRLFAFSSGLEALKFFEKKHDFSIDMVLCDWQLPDIDGLAVLKSFRQNNNTRPFYIVTAHTSEFLVRKSKRAKASGFISKPYITDTVIALIEKCQKRYATEQLLLKAQRQRRG
jgi:CheY-like chemotaxis protein